MTRRGHFYDSSFKIYCVIGSTDPCHWVEALFWGFCSRGVPLCDSMRPHGFLYSVPPERIHRLPLAETKTKSLSPSVRCVYYSIPSYEFRFSKPILPRQLEHYRRLPYIPPFLSKDFQKIKCSYIFHKT